VGVTKGGANPGLVSDKSAETSPFFSFINNRCPLSIDGRGLRRELSRTVGVNILFPFPAVSPFGKGRLGGTFLEKLNKRIQQLKKKRPGYKEILNFYQKVRMEQEKINPSLRIEPLRLKKEWKDLLKREGFPLLEKKDFPLDIESSISLFHSLCQIGKEANPHMAEQARKIEEILDRKKVDLKKLFKKGFEEKRVEEIADEHKLDKKVILFFVRESIKPSIQAGVEKLSSVERRGRKTISPLFLLRISVES
jgi:hypothetical protein